MSAQERETLRLTFEQFWAEIKGARLTAGSPSSRQSAAGVSLAQEALRLAGEAADEDLLVEARWMLAYTLTADEKYADALPYWEQALSGYEQRGRHDVATGIRIGFITALTHAGKYREALEVASVAERWLKDHNDHFRYARLCTNIANLYNRLDQHKRSYDYYVAAAEIFEKAGDHCKSVQHQNRRPL